MRRYSSKKKRIFICSKYAGDRTRNVEIARQLCRRAIRAGHAPFAPHLIFTQFLDDTDPAEREQGIGLGLLFMEVCDEVWAYVSDDISEGMKKELARAVELGKPVVEITEAILCSRT